MKRGMSEEIEAKYMRRCVELAAKAGRAARPNPNVGCVIVNRHEIIGEGWHHRAGEAHAEVNAIASVTDPERLKTSTLYVSLEPCSHWGKTPPCADLIIQKGIPRVVIGMQDPFAAVSGRGIARLREAGVDVTVGVCERECRELNRDFITFHARQRPYIVLKWAETADGYLDNDRPATTPPTWMTGPECRAEVHRWRAACDAICVGTHTLLRDNPSLTVREVVGHNPLRIVLDRAATLPLRAAVFDGTAPTLILTAAPNCAEYAAAHPDCSCESISFGADFLPELMTILHRRGVMSLLVEGGAQLLETFLVADQWDEIRRFRAPLSVTDLRGGSGRVAGCRAPTIKLSPQRTVWYDSVRLDYIYNPTQE